MLKKIPFKFFLSGFKIQAMIRGRFSSIFTRRRNSLALRSPLAQFENESFVELNDDPFKTEIRKLAIDEFRSFTLVTRPSRHGTHTTVGLCFPAGSRHTDAFSAGISHLDQALAFGKCSSFQSRDEIRERVKYSLNLSDH